MGQEYVNQSGQSEATGNVGGRSTHVHILHILQIPYWTSSVKLLAFNEQRSGLLIINAEAELKHQENRVSGERRRSGDVKLYVQPS